MSKQRQYQSKLREKRKQLTIEAIVQSTYDMHSEGITDVKEIAENAGVSVPTIRKYFPTNEDLFRGCANHFLQVNKLPEIHTYFHLKDIDEKVTAIVTDFYTFHEDTMEIVWLSFRLREQSKVMRNSSLQNEALVKAAAEVMLQDMNLPEGRKNQHLGFIRGLLHPLFYRSLRTVSCLDKESCVEQTKQSILLLLREEKE